MILGGFNSLTASQFLYPTAQWPPQHIPIRPKDIFRQSFLRLLPTIAVHLAISSNTQFHTIPTLMSLVPLGISLKLKGAIFDALAAFCEPGTGVAGMDICKSVWTLMVQATHFSFGETRETHCGQVQMICHSLTCVCISGRSATLGWVGRDF